MNTKESYNSFRVRLYLNFRKHINESALSSNDELPAMLFTGIKDKVQEMQKGEFKYKIHRFANHEASSQTACVNLFVPVLESPFADQILKSLDACPKDFSNMAKDKLHHGYRFEFWDSTNDKDKGILGDHTKAAGTDCDLAIAYYNTKEELCLWLIEHKLTEREFSVCGAYKSKRNNNKKNCKTYNLSQILENPELCHYHSKCNYNYWKIMREYASKIFGAQTGTKGCPFRDGMNQLWRNQMLALALEKEGLYHNVTISVVHHPDNRFLKKTMDEYSELTGHSPKFNSFTSNKLIESAKIDDGLKDWIKWYTEYYLPEK